MTKYQRGDKAYIIINNSGVLPVTVKSYRGGFYIVQPGNRHGAVRLRESRLYPTWEDACAAIPARIRPMQWWPR